MGSVVLVRYVADPYCSPPSTMPGFYDAVCLSLNVCGLLNPGDELAKLGPGARRLVVEREQRITIPVIEASN